MKKLIILFLLSLVLIILDNSVMPFVSFRGYYPSLLFIFIIFISINSGSWEALWLGIFCGFLQDIFFYNSLGINILADMLCCVAAAEIGRNIFKGKILVPVITCFLLSLTKGLLILIILYALGQFTNVRGVIFNSIYTFFVAILLFKPIYNLSNKKYMRKKWKF